MAQTHEPPMQTIVIGHRNPDMDSICAAIGYAELKRLTGTPNVVAARAGSTNERIDFALEKFGVEPPSFVADLSPRVRDVMERELVTIGAASSIYEAVQVIEKHQMRGLPVVGPDNECLGLLSLFKVLQHLFPAPEASANARVVRTSLAEIIRTINGEAVVGSRCETVRDYLLLVGAMDQRTFRERIADYEVGRVVVIVGDRSEIILAAIESGVRAIIVTGGLPITPEFHEAAQRRGVAMFSSPGDTATTVLMARGAINVGRMLEGDYVSFTPETLLETAREATSGSGQFIFPVLEGQRLVGLVSKGDFLKTIPRQLILVDHNELSQAVAGAEKTPIVEILDHHRIGGFATDAPILFWNNPVGSTSTIVAMCYRQEGVPIPKPVAGLLMAGLISDTLNLTSPTATPVDGEILRHLSEIAETDPAELAEAIFSVGSPLLTMSAEAAINVDCKEYEEEGVRFSVAQIEELSFTPFQEKQAALLEALDQHCRAGRYLFSALLVTDISTKVSILLVCGAKAFRRQIDYPALGPNQWELDGVVSRKKQLLPYLLGCLQATDRAALE
ncbi:MAG TPA: putative manganese-dependent inorganic diphosphatase [Chthoniobacteraceae bacterium]|nr:putative manganese-dependent inorganic diphosphatase [Chthoniobacteraceae bacterium]